MNKYRTMMIRLFLVLGIIMLYEGVMYSQPPKIDKERFFEMYKNGLFERLSPSQIRLLLNQSGLSEEEAFRIAKERNIDLSKYLHVAAPRVDTTRTPIVRPVTTEGISDTFTTNVNFSRQQPDTARVTGQYGLSYFGYDIFKQIPTAFEPNAFGLIDPGYLVGPEDVLRLSVWGQAEFQYELEVDREGKVFIPNVGQVFVTGTPIRDLEKKLKNQLSKFYSGLATSPQTVFMDVTISKLRPLRVFVMGDVKYPGGYTISSYATVFNALYAVGGPLVKGSLRTIKVLRDNKLAAVVDLYDYLLRGDKSSDIRLQNNDIVFISPRGKTVSVRGEVKRPAIYELKENEQFSTLLELSGGLNATAYLPKAQIDRVKPFEQRNEGVEDRLVIDVNLQEIMKKGGKDASLFDGDDVQIFSILDAKRNYVYIKGSVWRPGTYELDKVKTIRGLINAAEGTQPKTYLELAHLIRTNEDMITRRLIPFELKKVLNDPQVDQALMPQDSVVIFSTEEVEVKRKYISIWGEIKYPGRYPLRDNMTLADLIIEAGGFTEEADVLSAEVSRIRPEGLRNDSLAIILHPKLSHDFSMTARMGLPAKDTSEMSVSSAGFFLRHRDEALIRPNPDYTVQHSVRLTGDIMYPGTYSLKRKGEQLSEILTRAGGPTKTSYFGGTKFYRGGERLLLDFNEAYYKKNPLHDILMLRGDSIYIPSEPHTILVVGEVNNPGLLSFLEGDDVLDYIDRAGGLTDSANYAILIKPTGESKKVKFGWFRANPEVTDGSSVTVLKIPPPSPEDKIDWAATIKETFAIVSSAATISFIVYQVTKK